MEEDVNFFFFFLVGEDGRRDERWGVRGGHLACGSFSQLERKRTIQLSPSNGPGGEDRIRILRRCQGKLDCPNRHPLCRPTRLM